MSKPLKNPTTYIEQVQRLISRGCVINDEQYCIKKLSDIGYYRLSAYFLPFKTKEENYIDGTTFDRVINIYEFDSRLRGVLFSAIEDIEVYLKSNISYYHAHKYGAEGYLDPSNFTARHDAEQFKDIFDHLIKENENALFVRHHIQQYDKHFPIWVAAELFTFGMLSYFYSDLKYDDRENLADALYRTSSKNMISWLRCCTDLRNICAHYGRLYYRIFPAIPAGITLPPSVLRRLWGALLVVKELYPDANKWNSYIVPSLGRLFKTYANDIDLYHIAFPSKWKKQLMK